MNARTIDHSTWCSEMVAQDHVTRHRARRENPCRNGARWHALVHSFPLLSAKASLALHSTCNFLSSGSLTGECHNHTRGGGNLSAHALHIARSVDNIFDLEECGWKGLISGGGTSCFGNSTIFIFEGGGRGEFCYFLAFLFFNRFLPLSRVSKRWSRKLGFYFLGLAIFFRFVEFNY